MDRCNALADVPRMIFKKDIWRAANHTRARQFEHWQARDEKATAADEKAFTRLISKEPKKFVTLLTRRKII